MKLELLLGILQNLSYMARISILLYFAVIGVCCLANAMSFSDGYAAAASANAKRIMSKWKFIIVPILIAAIPNVHDLWKIRIDLVKFELASPENVQKGAEEIGRVAHNLECKYLGCDEPKEKK